MAKFFFWLLALPLLLFFTIFAVSNREVVELTFWPFPVSIAAPLYLFFLLTAFSCFFFGAIFMWFGQHKWRAEARALRREKAQLEKQLVAVTPVPVLAPATVTATTLPRSVA